MGDDIMSKFPFIVFPALGYWEIDGKPVSSKEAQYGLHPDAVWKETEAARCLTTFLHSDTEPVDAPDDAAQDGGNDG